MSLLWLAEAPIRCREKKRSVNEILSVPTMVPLLVSLKKIKRTIINKWEESVWIPRGRVNFNKNTGKFEVIIIEFQFPADKTVFLKGEHWQLGHGWSKDFYK